VESEIERVLAEGRLKFSTMDSGRVSRVESLVFARSAMANAVGLMPVAEAAAEAIRAIVPAMEVSISLLDGAYFWDLVFVSDRDLPYPRFPEDSRTPIADFPIATERVLSGKGYFSGDAADEAVLEYERQWSDVEVGAIMGVPIVALGGVHGEVFFVRDKGQPPFTRDDLDIVSEIASLFGARLPALLANYADQQSEPGPAPALTARLNDLLAER